MSTSTLYTVTATSPHLFATVDVLNGAVTPVGSTPVTTGVVRGLTCVDGNPNKLYMIDSHEILSLIDPSTGTATVVGTFPQFLSSEWFYGLASTSVAAANTNGFLYTLQADASQTQLQLFKIDPTTGVDSQVGGASGVTFVSLFGSPAQCSPNRDITLSFDNDGVLWAVIRNNPANPLFSSVSFYIIDIITGVMALEFTLTGVQRVRGGDFVCPPPQQTSSLSSNGILYLTDGGAIYAASTIDRSVSPTGLAISAEATYLAFCCVTEEPPFVPCFVAGTKIFIDNGGGGKTEKSVENIQPGDTIGGYAVDRVTSSLLLAAGDEPGLGHKLVRFEAGSLGHNTPSESVTCTDQHSVLLPPGYRGGGDGGAVVKVAGQLINNKTIRWVDHDDADTVVHHVVMRDHEWIWLNVGGALFDSLRPDNFSILKKGQAVDSVTAQKIEGVIARGPLHLY